METRTAPRLAGGRYHILGLLGEGGMARVFDAFDERLGRPVAVKVLRPETQALPGMRERFEQEAHIAASLIHPNIVSVLDHGEDHWLSFLIMERLPGTTLRDEIARGPLAKQRVLLVVAEMLAALAAAHTSGVLHRDVKPSNILLREDGHTKITDFGIAKSFNRQTEPDRLTDDITMAGFVLGTPGYLSPERRSGRAATVQSDLYSVGAVMVETLTGRRIGHGTVMTKDLPQSLRAIACRALAVDPRDRYTSADDMLHALSASAAPVTPRTPRLPMGTATSAVPATPPPAPGTAVLTWAATRRRRNGRPRRWHPIISTVVAVVTLVAALLLLLELGSQPTGPAATAPQHEVALPRPLQTDTEAAAITSLATSLASGGFPDDGAMAAALDATAGRRSGAERQSSAQQALALAQVLLDRGGITSGQYQDVVSVLQPTGATVMTSPTSALTPSLPEPFFRGHGHGHGYGYGRGGQR